MAWSVWIRVVKPITFWKWGWGHILWAWPKKLTSLVFQLKLQIPEIRKKPKNFLRFSKKSKLAVLCWNYLFKYVEFGLSFAASQSMSAAVLFWFLETKKETITKKPRRPSRHQISWQMSSRASGETANFSKNPSLPKLLLSESKTANFVWQVVGFCKIRTYGWAIFRLVWKNLEFKVC